MIPKIIHYCWFGNNPKPQSVLRCIESWKKHCPGFEIREWTENDFDITQNEYTRQAYEAKAWGFVPDYIRLWIVYHYGGIYLDTDVQIIKDYSPLCKYPAFAGLEDNERVALGLGFGAEPGNPVIKAHMEKYEKIRFINPDGSYNKTPSPDYTSEIIKELGLETCDGSVQDLGNIVILPQDYLCPKEFYSGITRITKNTYSIHQYDASWYDEDMQRRKIERWKTAKREYVIDYLRHLPNHVLLYILGTERYSRLKKFIKGE